MKSEFYALIFDNTHGSVIRNILYQPLRLKVFLPRMCGSRFIDHSYALTFGFSWKSKRKKIGRVSNNSNWMSHLSEGRLLYCIAVYFKNRPFFFLSQLFWAWNFKCNRLLSIRQKAKGFHRIENRPKSFSSKRNVEPLHENSNTIVYVQLGRKFGI